jgi:WD40 repeat protein
MRGIAALSLLIAQVAIADEVPLPCASKGETIAPSGEHAAIVCPDKTLRLIAIPSGKEVLAIKYEGHPPKSEFSRDGKWLALGFETGKVRVLSTSGGGAPREWTASERPIERLFFLPGGQLVLMMYGKPAQVWTLGAKPTMVATLPAEFGEITGIAVSPDGNTAVTTSSDTVVRFWDASWKLSREFRELTLEPFAVTFSLDGKLVLVTIADGDILVLDAATGAVAHKLKGNGDPADAIEALADGDSFALATFDADGKRPPRISIWSLRAGAPRFVEPGMVTGGGIVKGELWLARHTEKLLEIWKR